MKVICIDGNWNKGTHPTIIGPKETEIVTVVGNARCCGVLCYQLAEYKDPEFWEQENFVPLSNKDESVLTQLKHLTK